MSDLRVVICKTCHSELRSESHTAQCIFDSRVVAGCGSPVETSAYGVCRSTDRAGRRDIPRPPSDCAKSNCARVVEVTASPLPFCRYATFPLIGESSSDPYGAVGRGLAPAVKFVRNPTLLGRARSYGYAITLLSLRDISPIRGITRPYGCREQPLCCSVGSRQIVVGRRVVDPYEVRK